MFRASPCGPVWRNPFLSSFCCQFFWVWMVLFWFVWACVVGVSVSVSVSVSVVSVSVVSSSIVSIVVVFFHKTDPSYIFIPHICYVYFIPLKV